MGTNVTMALIFVMTLNTFMFLSQIATTELNPLGPEFYHCEGSMLESFGNCDNNGSFINDTELLGQLPGSQGTIGPTDNNVFLDMFASVKNWFITLPGINYLYGMVKAPYNILKALNLPVDFVYALGTLWYAISLFLVISFIWGRDS